MPERQVATASERLQVCQNSALSGPSDNCLSDSKSAKNVSSLSKVCSGRIPPTMLEGLPSEGKVTICANDLGALPVALIRNLLTSADNSEAMQYFYTNIKVQHSGYGVSMVGGNLNQKLCRTRYQRRRDLDAQAFERSYFQRNVELSRCHCLHDYSTNIV
ncbi:hypothetical protein M422DRAFT_46250 [Sphaerobolus stellatus SS14]|uniref:Uncharacterized protein n=1 Tax=Sphaerobolus stellatus (strain SS14) TaxID=990650 RepID=A0A0C9VGN7_SPHS4|nr:hypothetical protein M422DRAFT_46250 [Sphaerobolus stellatus SS14]